MPKLVMTEAEEWPVLPPDTIIGVRVNNTKVETIQGSKGDWEKLSFEFEIVSAPDPHGDQVGGRIWGDVPFRLTEHVDNRLRQWVEALFGIELSAGFELDTDMLNGREAKAIVANYDRRSSGKGHKVDALIPMGGQQPSQAAQAVVVEHQGQPVSQPVSQEIPF